MPDQPDPMERLSRFAEGLEGGDMLSAADVRRRGDQIRRRRNTLVAGGAALAVAAVAVPVFAIAGGGPKADDRDLVTKDPSGSAQVLVWDDLLTDDDTEYVPGGADWFTVGTYEAGTASDLHPCAQQEPAALGAETSYRREFELRNLEPGAPEVNGDYFAETVAEFRSAEEARAAYEKVAEWILDCEGKIDGYPDPAEYNIVAKGRSVDVPGGDAVVYDMHWGPLPPELDDPIEESAFISETGIVLADNRIAVLTSIIVGQDYNFLPEEGGTPVERMLPPAAERLAPGD